MTAAMRGGILAGCALACALLAGCIYAPFDLGLQRIGTLVETPLVRGRGRAKIALLRLDGPITEHDRPGGLLGSEPSVLSRLKEELDRARADRHVVALLLRVNSPGGGVTASDLLYDELQRWREETGRPVLAYFLHMATSGAYYVAQACDWIVASPTAITGSIGVIAQFPNVSGLGRKLGVEMITIKSGPAKDLGNPFRPMAEGERALLQHTVDALFARFLAVVEQGRRPGPSRPGMRPEQIREIADGRVFTAPEALRLGLIDQVGYFEDALAVCKRLAGVEDATVVAYERTRIGGQRATIYSEARADAATLRLEAGGGDTAPAALSLHLAPQALVPAPRLLYIWAPGLR